MITYLAYLLQFYQGGFWHFFFMETTFMLNMNIMNTASLIIMICTGYECNWHRKNPSPCGCKGQRVEHSQPNLMICTGYECDQHRKNPSACGCKGQHFKHSQPNHIICTGYECDQHRKNPSTCGCKGECVKHSQSLDKSRSNSHFSRQKGKKDS